MIDSTQRVTEGSNATDCPAIVLLLILIVNHALPQLSKHFLSNPPFDPHVPYIYLLGITRRTVSISY